MEIRKCQQKDEIQILEVYRRAFNGFPWFEELSRQEVKSRWIIQSNKNGFACLVAVNIGRIIGSTWWDEPDLEQLRTERGDLIWNFAQHVGAPLIWLRETCVDSQFASRGVGQRLKREALSLIKKQGSFLLLTRLRDDNLAIIRINADLGFRRTGIRVPSSQCKDVFHEYWFLQV